MNPVLKFHFGSAGYCVLLMSLNWSHSTQYSRTVGITFAGVDAFAVAILVSAAVVCVLAWHCLRRARRMLESGKRVPGGRWFISRSVALYALPLLFHYRTGSSWIEPDGAFAVASGGYGHDLSYLVFAFAVVGLLLFQILTHLNGGDAEPNPTRRALGQRSPTGAHTFGRIQPDFRASRSAGE